MCAVNGKEIEKSNERESFGEWMNGGYEVLATQKRRGNERQKESGLCWTNIK